VNGAFLGRVNNQPQLNIKDNILQFNTDTIRMFYLYLLANHIKVVEF